MGALKVKLKEAILTDSSSPCNVQILSDYFDNIFESEEFDSDAVDYDFETQGRESVITNELVSTILYQPGSAGMDESNDDTNLIKDIYKFISKTRLSKETHLFGWRYFYWPHYQNIKEELDILWKTQSGRYAMESNPGYEIRER